MINIGLVMQHPPQWPKVDYGAAKLEIQKEGQLWTPSTSKERFLLVSRCLSIINIYDSPHAVFDKELFQVSEEKSCLFKTSIGRKQKSTCYLLKLLVYLKTWVIVLFGIGGARLFLRVVVTIISKRFIKKGIIVYYRI